MKGRKIKMRAFTLPGEEHSLNSLLNDPNVVVVEELKSPCPKEGVFMVLLKWEEWDEEEGVGLV